MAGLNLFYFLLKWQSVICFSRVTVFILTSAAQPRISAHPVLRQKRQLISTKLRISAHPTHLPPIPTQTQISAHRLLSPSPQKKIE